MGQRFLVFVLLGNGVENALVESNNVDFVGETAAIFYDVRDSSLYNNRFTRMGGAGGGGPFGVYVGQLDRVTVANNIVSGSISAGSTAIGIDIL